MLRFPPETSVSGRGPSSPSDESARWRSDELLRGANSALALNHRLNLLNIEAKHRLAQYHAYHSRFDPNQPRVPAGHPDGGQWTRLGEAKSIRLAANEKSPFGPGIIGAIIRDAAQRAIESYRKENGPWALFEFRRGAVTVTRFGGKTIFGSNSASPTYTRADDIAARRLRDIMLDKYPDVMKQDNIGEKPNDALFHAETTILLRAARENGGTLANQTLEVHADRAMCWSCEEVLPYVGLELGNPVVTFVGPTGRTRTMKNGEWLR